MIQDLHGRLFAVTGAAGGIGRPTCRLLLGRGATVLAIDPDAPGLAALAADPGDGRLLTHVSALESPEACADTLDRAGAPLAGLVHLAGTFVPDALQPSDRPVYDSVIASNLTTAYDLVIAALPRLDAARPGHVVLTSSLAFRRGATDHTAYSAAKGGLVGLTRSLARRLAPDVLVNALAPGLIETGMSRSFFDANRDRLLAGVPLGRFGRPEEVAAVIGFLCSDAANYMTGQTLNIDGGIVMG
jgi:3-oxoacyl-[acyl-carrier protein] reductase